MIVRGERSVSAKDVVLCEERRGSNHEERRKTLNIQLLLRVTAEKDVVSQGRSALYITEKS